jgi:hypothetical protein
MRIKTNLSSKELRLVSKGLANAAGKNQVDGKFMPENDAESELVTLVNASLDQMLGNLSIEIKELFNE